jgi:hypothetical protein
MACGLTGLLLVFFQILVRDVVFRNFVRPYLTFIGVRSIFDAFYSLGFERVSFFEQFVHALRIRALTVREALKIARLAARARTQTLGLEHDAVYTLALAAESALLGCFFLFWRSFPGERRFFRRFFLGRRLAAQNFLGLGQLLLFAGFVGHGWSLPLTRRIARISCWRPAKEARLAKLGDNL